MVIAYIRVSTEKQDLMNQKKEIIRYATNKKIKINRWIEETVSGTISKNHRKLEKAISQLEEGDTLIITEISRLSRSLLEILTIMEDCVKRGIKVYSVKDGYTFDNSINSTVLIFAFGLVAEIERKLISARTKEALANRKAEGKKLGREFGFCPQQRKLVAQKNKIKRLIEQDTSVKDICKEFNISRSTFNRFRKEHLHKPENVDQSQIITPHPTETNEKQEGK